MADSKVAIQHLTFKYRLLPTKRQHGALLAILESQRILYNAALQERIECYRKTGKGRSYVDQCAGLAELRDDPAFKTVPSNLQRWTLKRVDESYKGFFMRLKRGGKAGFPRFRGKGRWKAFGFKEMAGLRFDGKRLRFKGLCSGLRVHVHRPLPRGAAIKSAVFRRDVKGWFVCFQCEVPAAGRLHAKSSVGIDVGIRRFATLSSGEFVPSLRLARRAERELRRRQRALSRCLRGSKRREKVRAQVARLHDKTANARRTFVHQQSARIAREYRLIAVEDLRIGNMVKNPYLAKDIGDAGWGVFVNMLTYKAARAGGTVMRVNPRNTSQNCSGCGSTVPKSGRARVHRCGCGLVLDRDVNAARNILALAVTGQGRANVADCGERSAGNLRAA